MLHYKTIEPNTPGILKKIQQIKELYNVRLVGGTSLALQIGHRKSIDLDFLETIEADNVVVSQKLKEILDFYMQKYDDASKFLALRSLGYFEDADENEQPEMIIPAVRNEVKSFLSQTLENYIKTQ